MKLNTSFILASRSPRRRHLLELLDFDFEIVVSEVEEDIPDGTLPQELARDLAYKKASAVAHTRPAALVLGADTIVVLDDAILGKPSDAEEARAMLRRLSGRTHTVFTGIALLHLNTGREVMAVEATDVTFAPLSDEEINSYVATGSPMDKAGGYGIQDDRGALYISRIDGDYYNVVGLPLHLLYRTLKHDFSELIPEEPPGQAR